MLITWKQGFAHCGLFLENDCCFMLCTMNHSLYKGVYFGRKLTTDYRRSLLNNLWSLVLDSTLGVLRPGSQLKYLESWAMHLSPGSHFSSMPKILYNVMFESSKSGKFDQTCALEELSILKQKLRSLWFLYRPAFNWHMFLCSLLKHDINKKLRFSFYWINFLSKNYIRDVSWAPTKT